MKTLKYILGSLLLASSAVSCSDWLEVMPENKQVADDYWTTRQDVDNMLFGGYNYLRSNVEETLIPFGELRAGLIYNKKGSVLQQYRITATSSVADWGCFYKIINLANTVLDKAAIAQAADLTYTKDQLNSNYTEAYFLRALSYYYLVRNWKDVPLVTKPFENDEITFNYPTTPEKEVLKQIKSDIVTALQTGAAKEEYETTWETKGRATKWALYALMADVCLWDEDYETCLQYCNELLNSTSAKAPRFMATASRSSWFSMFNPGNSNESIFELQWSQEEKQTNTLPKLFDDVDASGIYVASSGITQDFATEYLSVAGDEEEGMITDSQKESVRTLYGGIYVGTGGILSVASQSGYVWKYLGSTTREKKRTSLYQDPNFIIYRVADIILMKAEALLLVDGEEPTDEHKIEAVACINKIRERAGLAHEIEADEDDAVTYSQEELLSKVLDERKIEFFGEGKIWYDFVRMGRSNNNRYKSSLLIDNVVKYDEQASESWINSVLSSDNALFLPILNTELERNPLLIQNPYYN